MRRIGRIFKRAGETISNGNKGLKAAVLAASAVFLIALPAAAQDLTDNARYAAIVVDAQSGEVFYAQRADSARYPASLTKIMTLYMAFDALAHGTLKPTDQITMSAHATSQAPVKVYLRPGDTIDVDTAMRLIALYSANDLAVALAEKIGGGSEERFAAMMTIKAQELGMTHTRFVNANGLPDPRQISSARDLAILARAVMRDYPQYYDYFNLPSQEFRGRTYVNHNPLRSMPGIDGMKTGFTNAAGYNLVASGVRNNHRLIAVMLGGSNKTQRREHVTALMNTGFDVIARRDRGERIEIAQNEFTRAMDAEARMPEGPQPYTILADNGDVVGGNAPLSDAQLRETLEGSEQANASDVDVQRASSTIKAPAVAQTLSAATNTAALVKKPATKVAAADKPTAQTTAKSKKAALADKAAKGKKKKDPTAVYAVQIGAFKDKSLANDWAKKMKSKFSNHLANGTTDISKNDNGWYRTRFVTLTKAQASAACKDISAKHLDCMVIKPDA
ncbi:D-alanyl-D-alanine carboxypeptidase [Asticcacaulis sp.]|uniref:D-alanyl-D-alanine carboxypeptidase n=1 Tax=Asticcacaulis sp. TaxID=1872648 RepID=UPI003F7B9672